MFFPDFFMLSHININMPRKTKKFFLYKDNYKEIAALFIDNFLKCFMLNFDLTTNVRLFPCKLQCPFIKFMSSRPEKRCTNFGFLLMPSLNVYVVEKMEGKKMGW